MKSRIFILMLMASLSLVACGGGRATFVSPITPPTNVWTWVNGANVVNQQGTYGTLGMPASANVPGARDNAVSWTDASGNFWLFGGMGPPSAVSDTFFNDLWKYSAGQWTWMGGSNTSNQPGTYGTPGMAAPGNVPGARCQAVSWIDQSGNFWLFGGLGLDSTGTSRLLNDLWKYSAGQWAWMGGSNLGDQSGAYGTQGAAALGNIPGARSLAVSWTDDAGNFWLFGGLGFDSTGAQSYLNDLWKYSAGQWTWVSGSKVVNQSGAYGTQGMAAPGNVPGARIEAVGWTDAAGNLWLFGGSPGPSGQFELFNDLWKYNAGKWTWLGGSNLVSQSGTYGIQGTPASNNVPGARVSAVSWTDAAGNFWLFGGDGYDSAGSLDYMNDLWKYGAGQWTWVSGSNLAPEPGTYGTQGTAAPGNVPGARFGDTGWIDSAGNFWLFGGRGYDSTGTAVGDLNDLWKYEP
ncbi:MAG: kelch repeat-containing protein [Candidatus Sulfotelmatobacter sp.]